MYLDREGLGGGEGDLSALVQPLTVTSDLQRGLGAQGGSTNQKAGQAEHRGQYRRCMDQYRRRMDQYRRRMDQYRRRMDQNRRRMDQNRRRMD